MIMQNLGLAPSLGIRGEGKGHLYNLLNLLLVLVLTVNDFETVKISLKLNM